jgi:hypothetical protein
MKNKNHMIISINVEKPILGKGSQEIIHKLDVVLYSLNSSYLGGGDQNIVSLRPAWAKLERSTSKTKQKQKGWEHSFFFYCCPGGYIVTCTKVYYIIVQFASSIIILYSSSLISWNSFYLSCFSVFIHWYITLPYIYRLTPFPYALSLSPGPADSQTGPVLHSCSPFFF